MSGKKARTPEQIAKRLADQILEMAKREIEEESDGGFMTKAFIRLPDGRMDIIAMPFRNLEEKEMMAEMLRAHVRKHQAPAFVVAADSWMARVEGDASEMEAYKRRYPEVRLDPNRIDALMLFLYWTGGSAVRNYPYDRVAGQVVWNEEQRRLAEQRERDHPGRVIHSRFHPGHGLD